MKYIASVIMYSKDNCPWCDKARDLLNKRNLIVVEKKIGVDYTKADLIMKLMFRDGKVTVPQIWFVGAGGKETYVGGYEQLKNILDNGTKDC